jgi:uncharacterized protein YecE (DUF72 family)
VIRTGPAGWSYPDSPGHVYPSGVPHRFDALGYLARYFDVIEVNSTFYRPQPARTFASWARRVASNPSFRFTVKLWQRFTHEREGPWSADDVRLVTEGLAVLREEGRLGALLAQFPWSFKPGEASRDLLVRLGETFGGWPLVVEVRHGEWSRPEHLTLFAERGFGIANIDQPLIGQSLTPAAHVAGKVGYVRFHGRNYEHWFGEHEDAAQRYDYLYTVKELAPWVERIRALGARDGVADVYVITNNHFEGKGPANALMLRAMLEHRKVPAPPVLYATYRDALEPYAEPAEAPGGDAEAPSLF